MRGTAVQCRRMPCYFGMNFCIWPAGARKYLPCDSRHVHFHVCIIVYMSTLLCPRIVAYLFGSMHRDYVCQDTLRRSDSPYLHFHDKRLQRGCYFNGKLWFARCPGYFSLVIFLLSMLPDLPIFSPANLDATKTRVTSYGYGLDLHRSTTRLRATMV